MGRDTQTNKQTMNIISEWKMFLRFISKNFLIFKLVSQKNVKPKHLFSRRLEKKWNDNKENCQLLTLQQSIGESFYQIILYHKNFVLLLVESLSLRPWKGYHIIPIFFLAGKSYSIFSHTNNYKKAELFH